MPSASEELHAAAETRRELGPNYDEAVLLSLAERLEHRRLHPTSAREAVTVVIALGSIGLGVLVAAAAHPLGETGATMATIVAWICIAVINVIHARAR
ncbi:MAG: hypothetical protein QOJ29_4414 [Thermoleophilaceae bacterium]|jgi:hypothetical protein|nr:hypothetical protein [Thermoleophilaceae bacterium]